ncbi:RNA polymerase subunit sigma-70 [Colwellia sp. PAMC 20917]|jgi:RNA polymerase sigma factor (sigma-70 family)|uniref:RNA polymerase sigma factor n=1 Tax=unclassified Colwellia TaxID=196834 RepID=UPI0008780BD0|nr:MULTISPECIES: sigma-70 family RNA polymerase sigma factor [unclassified Colwellia]AOW77804.1 RNA polymerase subunit sigma-70 [Colwellia sp. PAMC 20917]MBA6350196.1 sigma-70 family RNA polymerase sigma factor [Colwellia sp. BRX8-9]MBA6351718.1 sigma-70 family RNA polymerase sigma factor [Colwellia sp. BRX9-1]MBA6356706.1 sigma-70 family RNA polymerase sigma factor [Colwellia sp. BRX8-3]MBA6359035.1 sigma-70 family RNA polymerase sigma factor [Colwellia sp. BRX8-6]|tara:strand:+ start:3697 stop:4299 length:603 start_codon:yes stop_codon:yes gene_type:complete
MNNSIELTLQQQDRFQTAYQHILSYSLKRTANYQQTFTQWMTEYEKLLRHIITGFEAKPSIQDELFQEIALNLWRALPSFRNDCTVKTFVARIAHNVLATHVAKAVKSVKVEQSIDDICQETEQDKIQPTPHQSLEKQRRQQRLAQSIRQLKLEQQQVITLALEGMSYQEIADILVISVNLVGVRLQRAKIALSKLMEAV